MEYRKLGNTDIQVSAICLGTMTFGEQNTEAEAHEQLDMAVDMGVNFVDTAELYAVPSRKENRGLTEKYIGSWIAKGNRDKIVLATKVTGPSPQDVIATMNELVESGKVRQWGISNETPWGTMKYMHYATAAGKALPVSVQNPYSLLNRTYEAGMAEVSIRENIGLLAYSPMAFGLLSGKYHKNTERKEARLHRYKQMARYSSDQSYEAVAKYLEIAERHGMSLAQMSLAFVTQQQFMTSNIIGATSLAQLEENIGSAKIKLSDEVLTEIEAVHNLIPNPAP